MILKIKSCHGSTQSIIVDRIITYTCIKKGPEFEINIHLEEDIAISFRATPSFEKKFRDLMNQHESNKLPSEVLTIMANTAINTTLSEKSF